LVRYLVFALVTIVIGAILYLADIKREIVSDFSESTDKAPSFAGDEEELKSNVANESSLHGASSGWPSNDSPYPEPLPVDTYLKAILLSDDVSETRSLKITLVDEGANYFQYQFESAEGELGILTQSPGRVFAFMQASDGVYEYAGDSLELKLRKSRMERLDDDIYRGQLQVINK